MSTIAAAPDILRLPAVALAAALHGRSVSCFEVMTAALDRIEALNPRYNAVIAMRPRDVLLREAQEADARLLKGEASGPLHGFPFAVKDLAAVRGLPMTMGSPLLKNFVPEADSLFVERLRAAGAIFIGKTNVPEFGLGSQTYNPVHGATRNAFDPALTAGGSSGGAAVALALNMLPLADGSDYGGSLRNPAGWNGVYGLRPGFGVVPADGREAWIPSMGVNGPMARNPRDLAFLLNIMAGHDPREPLSARNGFFDVPVNAIASVRGLRIAWIGDWDGALPMEPGVLEICESALKKFEALGCVVEKAVPDFEFERLWQAWVRLRHWQAGPTLAPYVKLPGARDQMKAEALWEYEQGALLSAYDVAAAATVRTEFHRCLLRFFERYDAFVLPTAQVFAFSVDTPWPKEIAGRTMRTYHEWMGCMIPGTASGGPCLGMPAGFDAGGRAMGLQIVTPLGAETRALNLAAAYSDFSS